MILFNIIVYTLFGILCIFFIRSGIRKLKEVHKSQDLASLYTNEEEHLKAIKESEDYEKGYFERIRKGEQSQQFLSVGNFSVCSFLRSLLAAENIPTYTENEHVNSMYSLNALSGNYVRAYEIVSDFISSHEKSDSTEKTDFEKISSGAKTIAGAVTTGMFFVSMPEGAEEAVHGIMILPRVIE